MECSKAVLDEFRHYPILGALNESQLEEVISTTRKVCLPAKTMLFEQGMPASHFYMIHSGQIKLYTLSEKGDEKVLEILLPTQSFGEAIIFMPRQIYPVSADAIMDSELYAFDMKGFRKLLENSLETCFKMMALMSQHLHSRISEINNLTLHNATYRFVVYLLSQIPEGAEVLSDIELATPKNIIASRLSIQPETFSRILTRMSKQGLIQVHGHGISLLDVDGLRNLL